MQLPIPDSQAQAHSDRLQQLIMSEIQEQGGWIPFSRYMELCLYAPGLGYYSAGMHKFGRHGDFITAPEIGTLFARTVAESFRQQLQYLNGGIILEAGGGSGRFAGEALAYLAEQDSLPEQWLMLERSADLRQRQHQYLQQRVPEFLSRVQWLDELPQALPRGVFYANEVLDALPVEVVCWKQEKLWQQGLSADGQQLAVQWRQADDELQGLFLSRTGELQEGYTSEICTLLPHWLKGISQIFQRGFWLFSDYGYPREAYYHPQRTQGTLQCHYRHRAHTDVLFWPGLQDITAHVDFDAASEALQVNGLQVDFIRYQGEYLLQNGLLQQAETMLMHTGSSRQQAEIAHEIKQLTLPGEMGERFVFLQASRK